MNHIEVMKQALRFLDGGNFVYPTSLWNNLRAAIEAAEKVEPVGYFYQVKLGGEWLQDKYGDYDSTPLYTHPAPVPKGWQRFAESKPTEWGSYLVWHPKYGIETLWWQLKDGGRDGRKAGHWYSEDDDGGDSEMNWRVTHWMPLPAAPKQEVK